MAKPLEGIKVIEIGQEIQGPFAGLFLADQGADVVKVENKETGDLSRWMAASPRSSRRGALTRPAGCIRATDRNFSKT